VIRALVCALLGLGRESFWLFDVQPASVVRVDLFGRRAALSGLWSVNNGETD
jgi:broad specificity phosphatase PhoE